MSTDGLAYSTLDGRFGRLCRSDRLLFLLSRNSHCTRLTRIAGCACLLRRSRVPARA